MPRPDGRKPRAAGRNPGRIAGAVDLGEIPTTRPRACAAGWAAAAGRRATACSAQPSPGDHLRTPDRSPDLRLGQHDIPSCPSPRRLRHLPRPGQLVATFPRSPRTGPPMCPLARVRPGRARVSWASPRSAGTPPRLHLVGCDPDDRKVASIGMRTGTASPATASPHVTLTSAFDQFTVCGLPGVRMTSRRAGRRATWHPNDRGRDAGVPGLSTTP